jgi:hypothetical protein
LQRKPANRLGLRGAVEVKEHAWLKFYPWKELYEKQLDSPFIPKGGDNFDVKYCNSPDKIGPDTKEKYDAYLRDESYKDAFKEFTYFSGVTAFQEHPKVKFSNPHINISNCTIIENTNTTVLGISNLPCANLMNSSIHGTIESKKDKTPSLHMEHKFLKIKKQSNSSSTSSLMRQYRQSSLNSTSTSIGYLKRTGNGNSSTQNNL